MICGITLGYKKITKNYTETKPKTLKPKMMLKQIGITKELHSNSITSNPRILAKRSASIRRALLESKFKKRKLDIFGFTNSRQSQHTLEVTSLYEIHIFMIEFLHQIIFI